MTEKRGKGNPAWEKGQSANPKGRPKGIKDRRVWAREVIDKNKDQLSKVALQLALEGNENMLKFFLTRAMPGDSPLSVKLESTDPKEMSKELLKHLSEGNLTPVEASRVQDVIYKHSTVVDVDDIKKKVEEIDDKTKDA